MEVKLVSAGTPETLVQDLNKYLKKHNVTDIQFQQALEPSGASMFYAYIIIDTQNNSTPTHSQWRPDMHEEYWTIGFEGEDNVYSTTWWNSSCENEFLQKGLVYKTKEEAEEIANKILSLIEEEV